MAPFWLFLILKMGKWLFLNLKMALFLKKNLATLTGTQLPSWNYRGRGGASPDLTALPRTRLNNNYEQLSSWFRRYDWFRLSVPRVYRVRWPNTTMFPPSSARSWTSKPSSPQTFRHRISNKNNNSFDDKAHAITYLIHKSKENK